LSGGLQHDLTAAEYTVVGKRRKAGLAELKHGPHDATPAAADCLEYANTRRLEIRYYVELFKHLPFS
jgi:hypothetical protein